MKKLTFYSLAFLAILVFFGSICEARHKHLLFRYPQPQCQRRPYTDIWGNHYRRYENLWKDSDRDGLWGYWDYNDRNPNIWHPSQKTWWR